MAWSQENWIVAVVIAIVAVAILVWLLARRKPDTVAPPAESATPAKPLEPLKPEIIAAEPARFKPVEPTPAPRVVAPPVPPVAAPTPSLEAVIAPAAPTPQPAPSTAEPVATSPFAPAPAPQPVAAPEPPISRADNLQLIKGLGPKLAALLNSFGVASFQQIADWTDADVAAIDPQLGSFQGRITRDNFIDQARFLARGDQAGFEAKYGALGGAL